MKKEPCVRFGIRIRPKISENPAARRKSRPPSVMLLTASRSQRLMWATWRARRRERAAASALHRRIVTRVHGLLQEPLLVVRPELAHVGIRLERRVDELVALPLAPPDVERAHHVAEVVEAKRSARRVGERHAAQGADQRLLVIRLPAGLLE